MSILGHIPELVKQEHGVLTGELRVGVIPTLSPYLVPGIASAFLERYPRASCRIEEATHGQIIDQLQQDQLDLGLMPTPFDTPGLQSRQIFTEQLYCYVPPESALLARQALAAKDLNQLKCLSLPAIHGFAESMQDLLDKAGSGLPETRIKIEANSLETLRRMVDEGLGYTLLPELAVRALPAVDRHRALPFVLPVPKRIISLVAHRRFLKQNLIQAFEKIVLEMIPAEMRGSEKD